MKKLTTILIGLLFLWFTLDMTGFVLGDLILVESAIPSQIFDIIWWFVFASCFIFFIWKDKFGKYALLIFLLIWAYIQYSMFFWKSFDGYYRMFANTHRLFKQSSNFLVKDTYHMVLDVLILSALICIVIYLINTLKNKTIKS